MLVVASLFLCWYWSGETCPLNGDGKRRLFSPLFQLYRKERKRTKQPARGDRSVIYPNWCSTISMFGLELYVSESYISNHIQSESSPSNKIFWAMWSVYSQHSHVQGHFPSGLHWQRFHSLHLRYPPLHLLRAVEFMTQTGVKAQALHNMEAPYESQLGNKQKLIQAKPEAIYLKSPSSNLQAPKSG